MTEVTPASAITAASQAARRRLLGGRLARVDLEGEADIAVAHDHARHHSERDHVLALRRVLDPGERRQNLLLGDLRHG